MEHRRAYGSYYEERPCYEERQRYRDVNYSRQDDYTRIGTFKDPDAEYRRASRWTNAGADQIPYGANPVTKRRRYYGDNDISELRSIKAMLSSVIQHQKDHKLHVGEKLRTAEIEIGRKFDGLKEKISDLRSSVRDLDHQLQSPPPMETVESDQCASINVQEDTDEVYTAPIEEDSEETGNTKQLVDLQVMDDIVYADSEEEDDFVVIEGSLGFSIIVDAEPRKENGKVSPSQESDSFPEECVYLTTIEEQGQQREAKSNDVCLGLTKEQQQKPVEPSQVKITAQPNEPIDPGKFTITCSIGNKQLGGCVLDLGSSSSIMPLKVAKTLGTPEMRETNMPLVLGDGTLCYPKGIIDDIPVRFKGHIFHTTFIVTDSANGFMDKIIFGRPFLSATGAEIFVTKERVDFYLGPTKEKHQVWLKKKPKPSKEKDVIYLGECKFLQEVVECANQPSLRSTAVPRVRKHVRKRKVKSILEERPPTSVKEWRVKEPHDPGGIEPECRCREKIVITLRDHFPN